MLKPIGLDRTAVRQLFNGKLQPEARADFLLQEAERRLLERLVPMRLPAASRVLDLGCGLGRSLPLLAQRFPEASVWAVDQADQPLRRQHQLAERARRGLQGFLRRWRAQPAMQPVQWVVADAHRLPLPDNSMAVIWSNLVFHWFDDPLAVLKECYRVLRPEGLLIFSAFGVDTARELRQAGGQPSTGLAPGFQDMHDWGDAMMEQGFVAPVMDMEHLRLTYQSPDALKADLAALGLGEPPTGVAVPALSIEFVFGHAWVPPQKALSDGLAPIRIVRRRPQA
ncbi:MAG: methyltransferase domain-containing protein [Lautropia sp.]|nr:methyltransferase domain-containing protein [Lautropia sp.]